MLKKSLLLPAMVLAGGLLLSGCTGGDAPAPNETNTTQPAPESTETPTIQEPEIPEETSDFYKAFVRAYMTVPREIGWTYYEQIGAKTFEEDPAERQTTFEDFEGISEEAGRERFDVMFGEVNSDIEQTAMRVSAKLAENPEVSLDELQGLVINRYPKMFTTTVEQDPETKYYFVIARPEGNNGNPNGVIVPQEGITPEGVGEIELPEGFEQAQG